MVNRINKEEKCDIRIEDDLVVVEGKCADEIARSTRCLQELSQLFGSEISFQLCISEDTGEVDELVIDTVGDTTSTILKNGRMCPRDKIQISGHTHPISGQAKFSPQDMRTVGTRLNENTDNCGCVVGSIETRCWCGLLIPHTHC